MDYLAFDAASGRVWVPAGNTGRIDVLDTKSGKLESIEGVATAKKGERVQGPTAASAGEGFVYVGNRADASICAYRADTLAKAGCATLGSTPDGVVYVATTHEVWVTTPREASFAILDVKEPAAPKLAGTLKLEGEPEGYAVDAGRGLLYTNLEDKDRTLAIDVKARKVVSTWKPECGEKGPRGLAVDPERRHLFVACTMRVETLDAGKDGAVLSRLEIGPGVDNIDWLAARHLLYAGSGKEARLTIAETSADGSLKTVATAHTAEGCRTVLVDAAGTAYLPDSREGRLVVVPAP
jgi:DNA-binding beta-propeller fold protein YncE